MDITSTPRTVELLDRIHLRAERQTVERELELLLARCEQQGVSREQAGLYLSNKFGLNSFARWVAQDPNALV